MTQTTLERTTPAASNSAASERNEGQRGTTPKRDVCDAHPFGQTAHAALRAAIAEAIDPAAWWVAKETLERPINRRAAKRCAQQALARQVRDRMLEQSDRVMAVLAVRAEHGN